MRAAFVIIDMQKQFLSDEFLARREVADAIEIINYVSGLFRAADRPVMFVLDHESCQPGEPGFALVDPLEADSRDVRIHKIASNGFRDTELADALSRTRTELVVFAGFKAEGCVLATVKGAEDRDIPHAVLRQAIISPDADAAAFVERIAPIVSYELVPALLG